MGELGQLLRETRKEKKLTLEQAEANTRIRQKYLVALEDENYAILPTPGHIYGFLKNYGKYLGLDEGEIKELYDHDKSARRIFEPRIFHPKNINLTPPGPLIKAELVLGLVIVVVIVAIGVAFWQYGWPWVSVMLNPIPTPTAEATSIGVTTIVPPTRTTIPTKTSQPPTHTPLPPTPTEELPTPTTTPDEPLASATPTPTSTPTPTPTATPMPNTTPVEVEGVLLQIEVLERAWLQVTIDGELQPGELLPVGETREWQGNYTIYFICGNAGGISITVNGEELGVLGERGQVIEKMWTPEGEAPTPTPPPE